MQYYQQKASKNKHLVRGFENTQENFFNFSAEVGQLLTRSFDNRRNAGIPTLTDFREVCFWDIKNRDMVYVPCHGSIKKVLSPVRRSDHV
jgi:hypothetical protein